MKGCFIRWIVVLAALLAHTTYVRAQPGFTIVNQQQYAAGALCISSLPHGSVKKGPASDQDLEWTEYRIRIPSRGSGAKLTVYDAPVNWAELPVGNCSNPPAGRRIVLAGAINRGELSLLRTTAGGQTRYQIDPRKIDLELGRVTVNPQPIFGGTVSFVDRLVWLYNSELIDIRTNADTVGKVVMEVTDIAMKDAQFRLSDGAAPVRLTLKTRPGANVFFSYDLADGTLAFIEGTMWSDSITAAIAGARVAGLGIESATLTAPRLELYGGTVAANTVLPDLKLQTAEVTHGPAPSVRAVLSGPLKIRKLAGAIAHSKTVAVLTEPRLEGVQATATLVEIRDTAGAASLSGAGSLDLVGMTETSWDGRVKLSSVSWPGAHAVVPGLALANVDLRVAGPKTEATYSGTGLLAQMRAGGLGLTDLARAGQQLTFGPSTRAGALTVPFDLSGASSVGQLSLDEPARAQVGLTAGVEKLALRGTMTITDGMKIDSVTVPRQGLAIAVRGATATRPLVYRAAPTFATGALTLAATTDLALTRDGSTGALAINASGVVLPSPELAFEQGRFRLNAPLQTSASVTMNYGLSDGVWTLQQGALEVAGIAARTIGDGPLAFDDLAFEKATLKLARLGITARDGSLTGHATGMEVTADGLTHGENPQLACKATKLELVDLDVTATQTNGELAITEVVGRGLGVTLAGLDYTSADGFSAHGDARLTADTFSSESVENLVLDIPSGRVKVSGEITGSASLAGFRLAASGSKAQLGGTVRLGLRGVSMGGIVPVNVDGSCSPLKLRAAANLGDLDFDGTVTDGALNGSVNVASVAVGVQEDGHYRCNFERRHHVKDQWVLFSVPCGLDGWNVKMCDVKAGPIDADIKWAVDVSRFHISATAKNTSVKLNGSDGITACGAQLTDLDGPYVAGAYVPIFDTGIPFIDDVINGFIVALGYAIESSLVNALGSAAKLTNYFYQPKMLGDC